MFKTLLMCVRGVVLVGVCIRRGCLFVQGVIVWVEGIVVGVYKALLSGYNASLCVYRAPSRVYKALLYVCE